MTDPKFNLIDEPWIKVMVDDGLEETLSLKELFGLADRVISLAGETPLQDTAVVRFLIALNVTVMYRYDENGLESAITNCEQAMKRFERIWNNGRFSDDAIQAYFAQWYDRFYLIGGDRPFYQVPMKYRKEVLDKKGNLSGIMVEPYKDSDKLGLIGAAAMNGEVLEAGNSPSVFSGRCGDNKNNMSLEEASRWLLYYMAFADCSSKIPGKWNAGMTFASSGANIHPVGQNLFQTIMLCSCMVDANNNIYKSICPAWESNVYTEINSSPYGESFPNNLPELYTQQSRKVVLVEKDGFVTGAFVAAGDKYSNANAFVEPMFAFHVNKQASKDGMFKTPNHMHTGVDGWKEFENIFSDDCNVIRWIDLLSDYDILDDDINIPFQITDIGYGSMSCGVKFAYHSTLTVNEKFFEDSDEMDAARTEIGHIKEFIRILKNLGKNIELAGGADKECWGTLSEKMRMEYESNIGNSFCSYLVSKISCDQLRQDELKFADKVANAYLNDIYVGVISGHGESTIGKAENIYVGEIYKMKQTLGFAERSDENGR